VADLHFEKGSAFAARGRLLPPYDTARTLDLLEAAVARLRPRTIVCVGDSFHDRTAADRIDAGDVDRIRRLTASCDWIWIAGNHDPAPPTQWGGVEISALRLEDGTDLLPRASHPADPPGDETQLRVALPQEVPPGATVTLTLRWRSTLPSLIARTGFHGRFHMVAQWFPKLAVLESDGRWASFPCHAHTEFYADFGAYDLEIVAPEGYRVGASGVRVGAPEPGKDGVPPLTKKLGAWQEKSMYGKTYMGIARITYLVGPGGVVLKRWDKARC
jgi:hypothetical protein